MQAKKDTEKSEKIDYAKLNKEFGEKMTSK